MKYIIRTVLALALAYGATKVLYPYYFFHVEHFEYQLLKVSNWLMVPFLSRFLLGALYFIAFLLLFYYPKIKWVKFLSPLVFILPFILNPIYPNNFTSQTQNLAIDLPEEIGKTEHTTILAFFSANCLYCKEGSKKLSAALQHNKDFPAVKVMAVSEEIENFFISTNTSLPYEIISKELFIELTEGSYPKYFLVENNKIIAKYNPEFFNYKVLHQLSNRKD